MKKSKNKKYGVNHFVKLYEKYGHIKDDLELQELFERMDKSLIRDIKISKKDIRQYSKKALNILIDIGIKYEEYEICSLVKKEIDRR